VGNNKFGPKVANDRQSSVTMALNLHTRTPVPPMPPQLYESPELDDFIKNTATDIIKPDMSDYDKVKTIHNWLIANTSLGYWTFDEFKENVRDDEDAYWKQFEAAGLLQNPRYLMCGGYSFSFVRLCAECGIRALNVVSGWHGWNIVEIDNQWYHVDVYWDKACEGSNPYSCFLISDQDLADNYPWYLPNGQNNEVYTAVPECPERYAPTIAESISQVAPNTNPNYLQVPPNAEPATYTLPIRDYSRKTSVAAKGSSGTRPT